MNYKGLNISYKKPSIWRQPTKDKLKYAPTKDYNSLLQEMAEFDELKKNVTEEVTNIIKANVALSNTKGELSRRLSEIFDHYNRAVLVTDDYDEKYLLGKTNRNTLNKKLQPWCQNLIHNIPRVTESPPLTKLFSKYKNVPAFIVLAGPSLKNNIEELKKVGDKGIIIATDTAFRPCLDRGLKVHLVNAHDANPQGMRFFLGKDHEFQNPAINFNDMPFEYLIKEILPKLKDRLAGLVYDTIGVFVNYCHPLTIKSFTGKELCFYQVLDPSLPVYEAMGGCTNWRKEITPKGNRYMPEIKGGIVGGSSVGHTATYLAVNLGCNPITIVGCDLSYPEGLTYIPGASNQKDASKQRLIPVRDLSGRKVGTNLSMFSYRMVFKRALPQIAEQLGVTFFNATEHEDGSPAGILDAGAEPRRLKTVIDEYCKEDNIDIKNMLQILQGGVKKNE